MQVPMFDRLFAKDVSPNFQLYLPPKFHYLPSFKKEKKRGFHCLNKLMHFQEETSQLI